MHTHQIIHCVHLAFVWGFGSFKDILDVVMVPVALILLGQWITHRWQDRQRDSATKTALVAEISELVMTTVMTIYLFITNESSAPSNKNADDVQTELDRMYKKWKVETCVVGSKLHAYFPEAKKGGKAIHLRWDDFSKLVSNYYIYFREGENRNDLKKLEEDKDSLFNKKAEIIASILTSKITGFRYKYK